MINHKPTKKNEAEENRANRTGLETKLMFHIFKKLNQKRKKVYENLWVSKQTRNPEELFYQNS